MKLLCVQVMLSRFSIMFDDTWQSVTRPSLLMNTCVWPCVLLVPSGTVKCHSVFLSNLGLSMWHARQMDNFWQQLYSFKVKTANSKSPALKLEISAINLKVMTHKAWHGCIRSSGSNGSTTGNKRVFVLCVNVYYKGGSSKIQQYDCFGWTPESHHENQHSKSNWNHIKSCVVYNFLINNMLNIRKVFFVFGLWTGIIV